VDARLDMRFGPHGQPAEDLLASCSEQELTRIFRTYGEEPLAAKIARAIVRRRQQAPIRTTFDLRDVVAAVVPKSRLRKTLSRTFQALRIAVNQELQVLEETLRCIIPRLQPGGRIVVISYHSLEDRIVKTVFREYARTRRPVMDNPYATWEPVQPQLRIAKGYLRFSRDDHSAGGPAVIFTLCVEMWKSLDMLSQVTVTASNVKFEVATTPVRKRQ